MPDMPPFQPAPQSLPGETAGRKPSCQRQVPDYNIVAPSQGAALRREDRCIPMPVKYFQPRGHERTNHAGRLSSAVTCKGLQPIYRLQGTQILEGTCAKSEGAQGGRSQRAIIASVSFFVIGLHYTEYLLSDIALVAEPRPGQIVLLRLLRESGLRGTLSAECAMCKTPSGPGHYTLVQIPNPCLKSPEAAGVTNLPFE